MSVAAQGYFSMPVAGLAESDSPLAAKIQRLADIEEISTFW
jgi:hypothetical protein